MFKYVKVQMTEKCHIIIAVTTTMFQTWRIMIVFSVFFPVLLKRKKWINWLTERCFLLKLVLVTLPTEDVSDWTVWLHFCSWLMTCFKVLAAFSANCCFFSRKLERRLQWVHQREREIGNNDFLEKEVCGQHEKEFYIFLIN